MDIDTIIQNPNEDEQTFYILMSEKGLLCFGGRSR